MERKSSLQGRYFLSSRILLNRDHPRLLRRSGALNKHNHKQTPSATGNNVNKIVKKIEMKEIEKLKTVQKEGDLIKYFENPSESIQMAAVQQNPWALLQIENPAEAVKLEAVGRKAEMYKYIENPTEDFKLKVVKKNGAAIRYMLEPSEEIQVAAVDQDPWAIKRIYNPFESAQLKAVQKIGRTVQTIKNPTSAVELAAVKQEPMAIRFIRSSTIVRRLSALGLGGEKIANFFTLIENKDYTLVPFFNGL